MQAPDGNIPWMPGGKTDPWNLVEAAMALDVGGRHDDAARAYEWLRDQAAAARRLARVLRRRRGRATPRSTPTSPAYVAVGVWHHYLSTGDDGVPRAHFWPVVETVIDYVARATRRRAGEIAWRADDPADGALLTGSSSIHMSLRCAIAIAEHLGHERPDWELSLGALAIAIAHRPDGSSTRRAGRWTGTTRSSAACCAAQPRARASPPAGTTFVVEGRGVRCVSDRPWITAAETCELVMALDAIGDDERARELFALGAVPAARRRLRTGAA